ncbi:Cysteine desulfuration protein SufE [Arboricoccus pini]|uniref:Cysteine desulfuration protein SufE n=2 Tax=Arboricoccus pini TaxID=1963835 RepID=A0A212QPL7_9PROT|nr:Cysteine desulfuration protein SufE [Arboricoccus pini]
MDQADSIAGEQKRIEDDFALLEDTRDKYEFIIELGKELKPMPDEQKIAANLVRGCQSQVWMTAELDPASGRLALRADSDAIISKGLVALVLRLYDKRLPAEILANPPDVFEAIGLGRLITPGRSNGLYAMVNRVRQFAEGFGQAAKA